MPDDENLTQPEDIVPEPPEETGELIITIEGEAPEPDEDAEVEADLGEKGRNALKAAREAAKQARSEASELKAKLAERDAKASPPAPEDDIGPEPTWAEFGYDDEAAREATIKWNDKKRAIEAKKAEAKAIETAREAAYQDRLKRYYAERPKVGVDDDAQARVVAALNAGQQSALIDACNDPAKMVAALAKTPKILAELSTIKEIHKFTYRLAQIEGKITVTQKEPPAPESRLRGTTVPGTGNWAAMLAAAEKKAEASGDRTEVIRVRRQMRDAGAS